MAISKVIVVGAGPSGLLLTLLLARAGIPVELLEMSDGLDKNPRASHYTADSCYEFDRAGVLDQIEAEGFFPDGVSWRRLDENKTRLVAVRNPTAAAKERYRMVCLPLHRLGKILEAAVLAQQPTATIRYGCKVVDLGQDADKAWVRIETPGGSGDGGVTETREADYLVGCDGANSTVRRRLFGDMVYPGFTWDEQIVATNVGILDPQDPVWKLKASGFFRCTTTSRPMTTTTPSSSSTRSTGTWWPRSRPTGCTASRTARRAG